MKKNSRGEQKEFQRKLRERERIIGERIQAKIETYSKRQNNITSFKKILVEVTSD